MTRFRAPVILAKVIETLQTTRTSLTADVNFNPYLIAWA
jgi:hypothetical protein